MTDTNDTADTAAVFTQGNLMRHVAVMSFTVSIGLMAIFAVDFVDMIFISMLGNVALAAAIGYAGAILFFMNSISIGLSIAAGALVSKSIGAGRIDQAREYATSVTIYAALIGVTVPILILANLQWCLGLVGAEGEARELASEYLWILLPSMPILGVAMTGMAILRAYGDARRPMYATLFAGIANAVLDPILIFGLDMGLQGAAIASLTARFVMAGVTFYAAIRYYKAFERPRLSFVLRNMRAVSALAFPAILTNVATPVGSAIVTREMSTYGSDAVAGMAIIGRLMPVAFSVVFALSGAIGPIIGQNFGAGLTTRVRQSYLDGLAFAAIYVLVVSLTLFLLREPLADLFDAQGVTRELLFLFCGPVALSYIFNSAIFVSNAAFNNLGHPIYSTMVNWGMCTLGTLPFVMAGSALYGPEGILIGQATGAAIFSMIAVTMALRLTRVPKSPEVEVEEFETQRELHCLYLDRRQH